MLLVYDPEHCIRQRILNTESIISDDWRDDGVPQNPDCGQALVGQLLADTAIGKRAGSLKRRRRLIEMACADGAVVFDNHPRPGGGNADPLASQRGKSTGGKNHGRPLVVSLGAHPIKVSSDGDVTVYFKSKNGVSECDAEMHFL